MESLCEDEVCLCVCLVVSVVAQGLLSVQIDTLVSIEPYPMHLKMSHYILRRVPFEVWQVLVSLYCPVPRLNVWDTEFHVWKSPHLRFGSWMFLVRILVFSSISLGQFKLFLEKMITSLCHYQDEMKAVKGHALCLAPTCFISNWITSSFHLLGDCLLNVSCTPRTLPRTPSVPKASKMHPW